MRVFVESNFVLELVLLQEQSPSCEQIVVWAESNAIEIVLPAYALVEPFETLRRRHAERVRLSQATEQQLKLLRRTTSLAHEVEALIGATTVLVQSTDFEDKRLQEIQEKLVNAARIVALDEHIMTRGAAIRATLALSGPDSLIYASVIGDLESSPTEQACFLTRDSKDFGDPEIVDELTQLNCTLITSFANGHDFIANRIETD